MKLNFRLSAALALGVIGGTASFPALAFLTGKGNLITVYETSSLLVFLVFVGLIALFAKLGMGVLNVSFLNFDSIATIEKKHPYLPSLQTVLGTIFITLFLFLFALKTIIGTPPFDGPNGILAIILMLVAMGLVSIYANQTWPKIAPHYVFAVVIGTAITFALIGFKRTLFDDADQDPFLLSLGVVCVFILWRFLFGPWRSQVKSTVLGTFLFWVALHMLFGSTGAERLAHILAAVIALVPAVIWCVLFLGYHKQRIGMVILMFFSGMISTVPILFYDRLVRSSIELEFFLFRIVPQSFTRSSSMFINQNVTGITGYHSTLASTLISFIIVGLIEEVSKFWVLKRSGRNSFTSIDDVLQLAIIVAIGFAFAENVLNPSYFISFVQEFLVRPDAPDWSGFFGNVLGRSILTNMVHIVSTGVLGYFFGLALFARPFLSDEHKSGKKHLITHSVHEMLQVPEKAVFRKEMLAIGLLIAITIHGLFNFLVTLPDILPGQPRTVGDIFGAAEGSVLHFIALLVIPSLFYVVGGFWVLSTLFYKKEAMKERGHLVTTDTFVATKIAV